ncbi:hypothetical protein EVG20_g8739 [Dentipellis fragilis]|uniref:Uncharacterized protein n=1 Tax=Dentipellis fragilis TaxID=205917 RepID=A0A4Y9Y543_9AGAM|nr:hypothetical protein EVG20_g8739 [Dentipellis fragilis]
MQPHQYLGANAFPDVDFYHSQSSSRSPSRAQHTNPYQQTPSRVHNLGSGLTSYATHSATPTLYNSATYSPGYAPARSVTPEPWEAATSEIQVSAYQHEMPASYYESQFSVNSVHDSLRDTGPWMYNPDDDRDSRVPAKRQGSRSLQAAVGSREARAEGEENPVRTDDSGTPKTRTNKARTAEQKARMAKSAANRRANDKDHLSLIKERLPPLGYGQEYNNRTALAGAIDRFNRDEEEINTLRKERDAIQERLNNIEVQLASEKGQRVSPSLFAKVDKAQSYPKESLQVQMDQLIVQWANTQADLEQAKAEHNTELTKAMMKLQSQTVQHDHTYAKLRRTEGELHRYKNKYGATCQ